ncbi:Na+/H+ antiporter [Gorillibacterium timonense]|uniref:Na+/H+ antiporter n=1 Tax=Gorillibacterium timonense TaxID=1689269 RepID=UPI00071D3B49|nr:Na+/H+ antiporter [Gorillibacterium timonense]
METFLLVLVLLILIALSHLIERFLPFLPVPLIQIGLGVLLALLPLNIHVELEPELFFVLFIAPLLFNDGRRTPRQELWQLRAPILLLALGLVFITVVAGGYAIHALIPSIPLAAAFALAAILSPTDAVAVGSMSGRVHLPKRIHRILEGEALMNDASGLVAFKFAVAAAVTGTFSLPKAALSFVLIAVGGLLVGAVVAFLIIRLGAWVRRLGMEDVTIHVLLQLVAPFVIYLVAEEIGVSGILAVVAAGVVYAVKKDRATSPDYKLQLVSASTWSVLLFILNGLVFLLLGLMVPDVMEVIYRNEAISNWQVVGYVLIITAMLMGIRFLWILLYTSFSKKSSEEVSLKAIALTSISGVRGAVTLAGAFSIPLVTGTGAPFPERDLILALAAGVILVSLLLASILLPMLADKVPEAADAKLDRDEEKRLMEIGLKRLRSLARQESPEGTLALAEIQDKLVRMRPEDWAKGSMTGKFIKQVIHFRRVGLQAERKVLERLMEQGQLDPAISDKLMERLDQLEAILTKSFDAQMMHSVAEMGRLVSGWFVDPSAQGRYPNTGLALSEVEESNPVDWDALNKGRMAMIDAAIAAIQSAKTEDSEKMANQVIARYEHMRFRLEQGTETLKKSFACEEPFELERRVIQEQRDAVQRMYEDGTINRKIAGKLRKLVDELEASIWE